MRTSPHIEESRKKRCILFRKSYPSISPEEWNCATPRKFFMRAFHAICDSKADGGEILLSAHTAHQMCPYACQIYAENDTFSLNNAYLKSEIQSKMEIDQAKKPWFTNPIGCIAHLRTGSNSVAAYIQQNEATLRKEFLDFLGSIEA